MKQYWETLKELTKGPYKSATDTLKNLFEVMASVALYLTIAVALGLIIYHVAMSKKGEEALAKARRTEVGVVLGYSVGVIVMLGSVKLIRTALKGEIDANFWLVMGMVSLVAVAVITVAILSKCGVKGTKYIALGFAALVVAYAIVLMCVIKPVEGYAPNSKNINVAWMYVFTALLVVVAVVLVIFFDKPSEYDARSLTYAAICLSTSFALSYVKFFTVGAAGGSVTLASLVPLALYSYMFGIRKGLVAGVVYGFLQFIQSPQFYEPTQALLDYPIAFGVIGLAGIGRKFKWLKGNMFLEFAVGLTIACIMRYAAHTISGYFVFHYGKFGWAALSYSLAYNSFVFVDLAVDIIVAAALFASKSMRRMILLSSAENQTQTQTQAQ